MTTRRTIAAGAFKARCLALLDEVAAGGGEIVITKRGRPVARVVPVEPARPLRGSIRRQRDLISPLGVRWDVAR